MRDEELRKRGKGICPTCSKNKAESLHTCPYQEDINDNPEYKCKCCDDCRHECLMDI